jgi:hypothetical protein
MARMHRFSTTTLPGPRGLLRTGVGSSSLARCAARRGKHTPADICKRVRTRLPAGVFSLSFLAREAEDRCVLTGKRLRQHGAVREVRMHNLVQAKLPAADDRESPDGRVIQRAANGVPPAIPVVPVYSRSP